MDIKVLEFRRNLHVGRLGFVELQYNRLRISCEVKFTKAEKHIWVKMPQSYHYGKLYNCCNWPNKEDSDAFQKTVLDQLKERYSELLALPQPNEIQKFIKDKNIAKKRLNKPKKVYIANNESLPLGKARGESRFKKIIK